MHFKEPEGLSLYSQVRTTCSFPTANAIMM